MSSEEKQPIKGIKWKYKTGGSEYSQSPAIDDHGVIYFGADNGFLYAINSNGTLKWKYEAHATLSSACIGSDGSIYVGGDDGYIYALTSTGALKWRYKTGGYIHATAALGKDDTVYIPSTDDYLYAITSEGKLKWRLKLEADPLDSLHSNPAVGSDETIYINSYRKYFYAINPKGTIKWRFFIGECISHFAIGSDNTVYIPNHYLYAIDAGGSLRWRIKARDEFFHVLVGPNEILYTVCADGSLCAISKDKKLYWKTEFNSTESLDSCPAIGKDGTIYIGSRGGLVAISSNGTMCQEYETSYTTSSPSIVADSILYVGDADGYLYAFQIQSPGLAESPWPMYAQNPKHTGRIPCRRSDC